MAKNFRLFIPSLKTTQNGCYAIAYGIESASPEILESLHKDIPLEQVEAAVHNSREAGLQVIGYLMLGSPSETPETIRQTIEFAKKLKLDFAQFSVTTPSPPPSCMTSICETDAKMSPGKASSIPGLTVK